MQTTFLQAFRGLQRGVVPEVEVAWLLTIAGNVCLERLRAGGRRRRVEIAQDPETLDRSPAQTNGDGPDVSRLEEALAGLPARQREAIVLREWRGLSYDEIGERLGLSRSSVEMLIFRARRSLARALAGETEPRRKRLAHGLDLGSLLASVKAGFAGGAAVKVAAAAAVVATGTAVVAGGPATQRSDRPEAGKPPPAAEAPAREPAGSPAADGVPGRGAERSRPAATRRRKGSNAASETRTSAGPPPSRPAEDSAANAGPEPQPSAHGSAPQPGQPAAPAQPEPAPSSPTPALPSQPQPVEVPPVPETPAVPRLETPALPEPPRLPLDAALPVEPPALPDVETPDLPLP